MSKLHSTFCPLVIGLNREDGQEVEWMWFDPLCNRMSIVGDREKSIRREYTKKMAEILQSNHQTSVYWITAEEQLSEDNSKAYQINRIPALDAYPDPPEDYIDRESFIHKRNFFVSNYMNLLCEVKGFERQQVLPNVSYRSHLEGPANGYLRAIQSIENSTLRQELEEGLREVEVVNWQKTDKHGYKFSVKQSRNLNEKLLSFLTAIWSFWAEVFLAEDEQHIVLIIEPPTELLEAMEDHPHIRNILNELLFFMREITDDLAVTLIVSSEYLFPANEHHYRHRLIFQTYHSDINVWSGEFQGELEDKQIVEDWKSGRRDSGIVFDVSEGKQITISGDISHLRLKSKQVGYGK